MRQSTKVSGPVAPTKSLKPPSGRRRTIEDLYWRWHLADGEIRQHASPAYEAHGRGGFKVNAVWVREWEDSETLSGKVFVPPPKRKEPSYEMSEAAVDAVSRVRRIDAALSMLPAPTRLTLWRALGAPVDARLFGIPASMSARPENPLEPGPALCNLLEGTRAAAELARRAGRSARAWLESAAVLLARRGIDDRGDVHLLVTRETELAVRRVCEEAREELDTAIKAYQAAQRLHASRRKGRERWT